MPKRKFEEAGTSSRKKTRAQQQESTAALQLSAFEELPVEVKDEIFQYLGCKDILRMALVSKLINFFIGTSSKVMNRFKITLDMKKLRLQNDKVVVGERNYSTLIVEKVVTSDISLASKLIQKFGPSVKEMDFRQNLSTTMLLRFLNICKNVQTIKSIKDIKVSTRRGNKKILDMIEVYWMSSAVKIEESRLAVEAQLKLDPAPMELAKLKSLECSFGTPALSLFGNTQLKELSFKSFNYGWFTHFEFFEIKKFLEKQNSLEILRLGEYYYFYDDFMSKMGFQLKRLGLYDLKWRIDMKGTQNLLAFIKRHVSTLEHLECAPHMIHYFAECKSLSTLDLTTELEVDWDNFCVMPNIQKLSIITNNTEVSLDNIAIKFPGLKDLSIDLKIWFESNCKGIEECLNLEKLTLKYDYVDTPSRLNLPNLKRLHLIECYFDECYPFVFGNQLEELTVESIGIREPYWLLDYLEHESTNLNLLKIVNSRVASDLHHTIEKNRHKIKNVILKNVKFIEFYESFVDSDDDW